MHDYLCLSSVTTIATTVEVETTMAIKLRITHQEIKKLSAGGISRRDAIGRGTELVNKLYQDEQNKRIYKVVLVRYILPYSRSNCSI